ncbi:hypothetical protein B0T14DRAFT_501376 [Immersiella caudata]|uniref:Secreted protein n=1 Tax=Immersiella caudata TaxID=314043 RepID=A0AA39XCR8_9PEZI|nr:hypothetical protein B0T14DRAFT_501376 [Immersiella caudata]
MGQWVLLIVGGQLVHPASSHSRTMSSIAGLICAYLNDVGERQPGRTTRGVQSARNKTEKDRKVRQGHTKPVTRWSPTQLLFWPSPV